MTRYACNFVPRYKTCIETRHENRDRLGQWKWDRLVTYRLALVLYSLTESLSIMREKTTFMK